MNQELLKSFDAFLKSCDEVEKQFADYPLSPTASKRNNVTLSTQTVEERLARKKQRQTTVQVTPTISQLRK